MPSDSCAAISDDLYISQQVSRARKLNINKLLTHTLRFASGVLFSLALLFFAVPASAADVTIGWDPNTEPNLDGYSIYFKKGSPGPPYDLFGNIALHELSDLGNPTFTLTDLEEGSSYFISLTAYDIIGNESDYSEAVCVTMGPEILPCTSAHDSGAVGEDAVADSISNSGGGGRGGATCFIEAVSAQANSPYTLAVALFLSGVVAFFVLYRKLKKIAARS